jgi:ABC-2 type transport system ATP-binding protein
MKMLLGLAAPTKGEARLLDKPIGDPASRNRVGFLPEHFRFHDWLSGEEFLHLHGQLYGMRDADRKQRVPQLLKRVGLEEHADKKLRGYSKGMLQRVGLAMALLNHPAVVFLDEPTSGLDPVGRILVRDIIREARAEGTTVFLNSHLLSEVEVTCDRVVFIKHGTVIKSVALNEIGQGVMPVEIRVGALPSDRAPLQTELNRFGHEVRFDDDGIHLIVDDQKTLPDLARWLIGQGLDLYALTPQHVSLEDMFLQIVGKDGGL